MKANPSYDTLTDALHALDVDHDAAGSVEWVHRDREGGWVFLMPAEHVTSRSVDLREWVDDKGAPLAKTDRFREALAEIAESGAPAKFAMVWQDANRSVSRTEVRPYVMRAKATDDPEVFDLAFEDA